MPIEILINKDIRRVQIVLSGILSFNEMVRAINSVVENPSFSRGYDVFSDHTRLEKPIEADQAKKLAEHLATLREYFSNSRWAIITKMEASYGMMRMLSVFLEEIPMELEVFYSYDEAEKWLSLPKRQT